MVLNTKPMKNQFDQLNTNLSNINHYLETIHHVSKLFVESGVLDQLARYLPQLIGTSTEITDASIRSGEWMSRKEAWTHLGIARSTFEQMAANGELAGYVKRGMKGKERK